MLIKVPLEKITIPPEKKNREDIFEIFCDEGAGKVSIIHNYTFTVETHLMSLVLNNFIESLPSAIIVFSIKIVQKITYFI